MNLFFHFKRLVGMTVQPLIVVHVLLVVAVALLYWRRGDRMAKYGRAAAALALCVLAASSFPPLTRTLARTLESGGRALLRPAGDPPYAVVVLGNGVAHPGDETLPALSRLNDAARARLVEGVRLSLLLPEAKLITTGYGMGLENCGDVMAAAALELGIAPERVVRLNTALDTAHEARLVKGLAGERRVVLVTSAAHMPRALESFARVGVAATPAPCAFIAPASDRSLSAVNRRYWRPRGANISDSEGIWHEFMGLAYSRLFGGGSGE